MCVHECIVREGVGTASKQLGVLERGMRITMLESRTADDGVERVRFDAGWASVASSTGQTVFLQRSGEDGGAKTAAPLNGGGTKKTAAPLDEHRARRDSFRTA